MNIAVMMASRENPRSLQAVLTSSTALASGRHAVTYVLGIDDDDAATQEVARGFSHSVFKARPITGPRPKGMGDLFNRLVQSTPADVYIHTTDRTFFLTPRWDLVVADAVTKTCPYGVFWLTHPDLPRSCIFPVITRRWLDAAGSVFTDYFPFWFDDTWLSEVWLLATGAAPLMLPVHAYREPHKTAKLRDLEFWYRFFFALRPERAGVAQEIARRLGLPPVDRAAICRMLENADAGLLRRVPEIEAEYGSPGDAAPPDQRYLAAKARAEAILAALPKR